MLNRSETARLVECRIGNENYCLDMGAIHSIQRYERMERNPATEGPLGWLNRQGSRLPVVSLALEGFCSSRRPPAPESRWRSASVSRKCSKCALACRG